MEIFIEFNTVGLLVSLGLGDFQTFYNSGPFSSQKSQLSVQRLLR